MLKAWLQPAPPTMKLDRTSVAQNHSKLFSHLGYRLLQICQDRRGCGTVLVTILPCGFALVLPLGLLLIVKILPCLRSQLAVRECVELRVVGLFETTVNWPLRVGDATRSTHAFHSVRSQA